MSSDYGDYLENDDDPEALFQMPKDSEDLIKMMVYELAVRNFIATFSEACTNAKTDEEQFKIKDELLDAMYEENPDGEYHKEVDPEIYSVEQAYKMFDDMVKRNEEGEYVGKNQLLTDVASAITIEIYEKYCLDMVNKGELQLYYDDKGGFGFRPVANKKEDPINKSIKPRRRKKQ